MNRSLLFIILLMFLIIISAFVASNETREHFTQSVCAETIKSSTQRLIDKRDSLLTVIDYAYYVEEYDTVIAASKEIDQLFDSWVRSTAIMLKSEYNTLQTKDLHHMIWREPEKVEQYRNERDSAVTNLIDFCIAVITE